MPPAAPRVAFEIIDPAVALQFTGQSAICDVHTAEQKIKEAQAAATAAEEAWKRARSQLLYRRLRWLPVRYGLEPWVVGLIAGSIEAFLLALICGLIFGVQPFWFLLIILVAYLGFGGGTIWFLRDLEGEKPENRLQLRTEAMEAARARCSAASDALRDQLAQVQKAQQTLEQLRQAMRSEINQRTLARKRLLAIDPGRLYPDEFERFVAEVFAHLGYQVQRIGKSGDQGVDIIARRGELKLAVQAKRYIGSVSNSAVQEVFTGMVHHQCNRCAVITTGDLTQSAIAVAQSTQCVLIGKERIAALIRGEIPF